jgi:hypothetical protein
MRSNSEYIRPNSAHSLALATSAEISIYTSLAIGHLKRLWVLETYFRDTICRLFRPFIMLLAIWALFAAISPSTMTSWRSTYYKADFLRPMSEPSANDGQPMQHEDVELYCVLDMLEVAIANALGGCGVFISTVRSMPIIPQIRQQLKDSVELVISYRMRCWTLVCRSHAGFPCGSSTASCTSWILADKKASAKTSWYRRSATLRLQGLQKGYASKKY